MNILFLSAFSLENTPASGAIEGSKKLFKLLEKCADKVVWKTLGQESPNLIKRIWRMLVGTTFCVPKSDCKEIEHLFLTNEFDTLFYDYAYGADFIKNFNCLGYKVFVVSNQAGIARGYYTENDLLKLQHYVDDVLLQHGAHIDEWFYCPHHPDKGLAPYNIACNCRKPKTGMVDKAVEKYDIDRQNSIMVGDKPWDIECGNRAGIQSFMLDEHGYIDLRLRISKKLGLIL